MSHTTILDRRCRGASRMVAALLLAITALAGTSRGQTAVPINFQDLPPLATNSYWNGSDGFNSCGALFNNSYDTNPADSGAWSGFSYSNVNYTSVSSEQDPIAVPTYQFAAVTGTGVGPSGIYAIGYGCSGCEAYLGGVLPTITIPAGMQVQSAMFTNTTYAAASMLNGDQFAKQFGPSDWFKLTITGEGTSHNVVGSLPFYLAQNGSIVDTWQSVDLSSLLAAKTLVFDLTSSDSDPTYGMNTPAYFAMGSLTLSSSLAWNGGGATSGAPNNWSIGGSANWGGGVPAAGQWLVFGAPAPGGYTTANNDFAIGTSFAGMTFSTGAAAYTLQGNAITLAGSIINQSVNNQTIGLAIQLAAGGGALDTGAAGLTITGPISGPGIGLTKLGSGTLTLSGSNNYTGGTSVASGVLVAENPSAIPGGSLLAIGPSGSVVLGAPGSSELGKLFGGAGPFNSQSSGMSGSEAVTAGELGGAINTVPEPGTLALLAAAAGCGWAAWRRRRKPQVAQSP